MALINPPLPNSTEILDVVNAAIAGGIISGITNVGPAQTPATLNGSNPMIVNNTSFYGLLNQNSYLYKLDLMKSCALPGWGTCIAVINGSFVILTE